MTVNSRDDGIPPRTFTFAVEPALRGRIDTRIELNETQRYDVYVSITDNQGRPSESSLVLIPTSTGVRRTLYERVGPPIGRAFGSLLGRLGRKQEPA
jgi:hypothetical protein